MVYKLYERIRTLRQRSGLSQVQLAKRLGITKSAVNSWEMGISSPSLIYIAKLSQIFGVTTDYLLGVNERLTIDITGLNEQQQQAVTFMIKVFETDNSGKNIKAP